MAVASPVAPTEARSDPHPPLLPSPGALTLRERREAAGIHEDACWTAIWAMYEQFSPWPSMEQ
eukprot:10763077-Alexandrium_andersonii.AAC.1